MESRKARQILTRIWVETDLKVGRNRLPKEAFFASDWGFSPPEARNPRPGAQNRCFSPFSPVFARKGGLGGSWPQNPGFRGSEPYFGSLVKIGVLGQKTPLFSRFLPKTSRKRHQNGAKKWPRKLVQFLVYAGSPELQEIEFWPRKVVKM